MKENKSNLKAGGLDGMAITKLHAGRGQGGHKLGVFLKIEQISFSEGLDVA